MIRKDDVEFVTGPRLDFELSTGPGLDVMDPDAITRVGNMLTAFHSAEDRVRKLEEDCMDDSTRQDDRSSAGHKKEAARLKKEAAAAEAAGNTTEAAALRAKAETHEEEIGRTDENIESPINGNTCGYQPPSPPKPGQSPLMRK